jgi:hypothetical protein
MAPEYIQTGIPAPSADLFAVGVILYEALAGRRPFVGDTTATVLYRIVHEQPAPLDLTGLPEVSPALQGLVMRALEKSPADRFPSAESLAAALRGALDPTWTGPTDAAPTVRAPRPEPMPAATTAGRPPTPKGRGRWLAAGAILLAGPAAWLGWRKTRPAAPPQAPPPAAAVPAPVPAASVPLPVTAPSSPAPTNKAAAAAPARPVPAPQAAVPPAAAPVRDPGVPPVEPVKPSRPEPTETGEAFDAAPAAALRMAEEALRAQPGNPKAHAIRIVALYDLGRYGELAGALRAALAAGVPVRAMMRFPRFAHMVKQELAERRLPEAVRRQLEELGEGAAGPRPGAPRPRFRFRG